MGRSWPREGEGEGTRRRGDRKEACQRRGWRARGGAKLSEEKGGGFAEENTSRASTLPIRPWNQSKLLKTPFFFFLPGVQSPAGRGSAGGFVTVFPFPTSPPRASIRGELQNRRESKRLNHGNMAISAPRRPPAAALNSQPRKQDGDGKRSPDGGSTVSHSKESAGGEEAPRPSLRAPRTGGSVLRVLRVGVGARGRT